MLYVLNAHDDKTRHLDMAWSLDTMSWPHVCRGEKVMPLGEEGGVDRGRHRQRVMEVDNARFCAVKFQ